MSCSNLFAELKEATMNAAELTLIKTAGDLAFKAILEDPNLNAKLGLTTGVMGLASVTTKESMHNTWLKKLALGMAVNTVDDLVMSVTKFMKDHPDRSVESFYANDKATLFEFPEADPATPGTEPTIRFNKSAMRINEVKNLKAPEAKVIDVPAKVVALPPKPTTTKGVTPTTTAPTVRLNVNKEKFTEAIAEVKPVNAAALKAVLGNSAKPAPAATSNDTCARCGTKFNGKAIKKLSELKVSADNMQYVSGDETKWVNGPHICGSCRQAITDSINSAVKSAKELTKQEDIYLKAEEKIGTLGAEEATLASKVAEVEATIPAVQGTALEEIVNEKVEVLRTNLNALRIRLDEQHAIAKAAYETVETLQASK